MPEIKALYQDTFAKGFIELLEKHGAYKINILDGQLRLQEQEKELKITRESLNKSRLANNVRHQALEFEIEKLNTQRSAWKMERDRLRLEITQLADKMLGFWKNILNDYEWSYINRYQFVDYLSRYKILLHTGNSQGLDCYSGPDVNKINDFIESYKVI